jgi:putative transposase
MRAKKRLVRYPDSPIHPDLQIAMPRAPRIYAPGGTVHVVARCNNREFCFTTPEDFEVLLAHLRPMVFTYGLKLFAYTLMSNHIHLLLEAPELDVLGRPLRWFMTETAKAFHRMRSRSGHFWERRYRACLVEEDLYALAALRYMDRNPVRAGLVEEPVSYPWTSCAVYAIGARSELITLHPSYLSLSRYAKVRQRHYRSMLFPDPDSRLDDRDARWTTQRAVGSQAFLNRHLPLGGRRRMIPLPEQIRRLRV